MEIMGIIYHQCHICREIENEQHIHLCNKCYNWICCHCSGLHYADIKSGKYELNEGFELNSDYEDAGIIFKKCCLCYKRNILEEEE